MTSAIVSAALGQRIELVTVNDPSSRAFFLDSSFRKNHLKNWCFYNQPLFTSVIVFMALLTSVLLSDLLSSSFPLFFLTLPLSLPPSIPSLTVVCKLQNQTNLQSDSCKVPGTIWC